MYTELQKKKKKLADLVKKNEYVVIAPTNGDLFAKWVKATGRIAPASFVSTLHDSLSNEEAGFQALSMFPANTPLTLYVITNRGQDPLFLYDEGTSYCKTNGIDL